MGMRPEACAVIIFAKAPIPGQVKTRLCPPLSPDEAASLHGTFVLDMLEKSRHGASQTFSVRSSTLKKPKNQASKLEPRTSNVFDRFLACAPSADHVFFKVLEERHQVRLLTQIGNDLGARMDHAFAEIFARGYQRAVLIGTDVPTLPNSSFWDAFELLRTNDLVLGPSVDGGYYLIGLRRVVPELFAGIPWSTERVLTTTQTKASALGLKTALLPVRRDVDTLDDLRTLIEESGAERQPFPSTRAGSEKRRAQLSPRSPNLGSGTVSPRTANVLRLLATRLRTRTMPQPAIRGAGSRL